MNLSEKEIVDINTKFGYELINPSNLNFAYDLAKYNAKTKLREMAIMFRGIALGHPFSNGNKRTAGIVLLKILEEMKADKEITSYNKSKLKTYLFSAIKNNTSNLNSLERGFSRCVEK